MKIKNYAVKLLGAALSVTMLLNGELVVLANTASVPLLECNNNQQYVQTGTASVTTDKGNIDPNNSAVMHDNVNAPHEVTGWIKVDSAPGENVHATISFTSNEGENIVASGSTTVGGISSASPGGLFPINFNLEYAGGYNATVTVSSGTSSEKPSINAFNESIKQECDEIMFVAANGTKPDGTVVADRVIHYDTGNALSGEIIKTMASVQGVTLEYTFEYKGIIFKSIITPEKAAAVAGENVPWCGPCYLANNFPTVPIAIAPAV